MPALASFLHERQALSFRRDGSFNNKADPPNEYTPASHGLTVFTGMGLMTLRKLGLTPLDAEKSVSFLQNNQQPDRGISKGLGVFKAYDDRRICRMPEAYYALSGLKDPKGLAQWVKKCLNPDGGYSRRPDGSPSDMESTHQALFVLHSSGPDFPQPELPPQESVPFNRFQGPCPQVFTEDPDELKYLNRLASFSCGDESPSFALAKKILFFVNDHLLFCSNYKQSSAEILIDGFATCGPQGRAYAGLASAAGIPSRAVYVEGHGCAESLIDGKWVSMDPMFASWGADEQGNLKSALEIRAHALKGGEGWTRFGDWRYKTLKIQQPDGSLREFR
jgi:hypothetical protein